MESKTGKVRHKGRQENTQRQARTDSKEDKDFKDTFKGRQERNGCKIQGKAKQDTV